MLAVSNTGRALIPGRGSSKLRKRNRDAHEGRVRPSINMTPLIDVLLVLLIIFMVIAPHRAAKLPVTAPRPAPPDSPPPPPGMLMLTVTSDARLSLNTTPINIEDLPLLLSDLMQDRQPDQRTLFIRAPKALRYDSVLLFVDLAKGAGVSNVGLMTDES